MEPVKISSITDGMVNEGFTPDVIVEPPPQYNGVKAEIQVSLTVTDPGFPRRGGVKYKGGTASLLLWPIFPQKMHENKNIWTQKGVYASPVSPSIRQCLLMFSCFTV